MKGRKEQIATDKAPVAQGPYSQAVKAGGFLYVSGQLPIDPLDGKVSGASIEEQTRQVLVNLENVLSCGGCSFDDVVKVEVFLADINDLSGMNAVYSSMFGKSSIPARYVVEVSGIPLNALIEVSCTAFAG